MTYDLVDNNGVVLFSNYPYADALNEQKWRTVAGLPSLAIIAHRKKPHKRHYRSFPRNKEY